MIGFGNYTKKAEATTITTLADNRLVKINPQEEGFFNEVLNFNSKNEAINMFIEAVAEVKEASLEAFYRVMYDPTEAGDHMVVFQKGNRPAVGHSYNWWVETVSKMSRVEGRQWHIATEYQYYAFLVWLINQLVKIGKSVEEALHQVVVNSKQLGHYYDSENSTEGKDFEFTGSRCVCGLYDLANTFKILQCSNSEVGGFWFAGGSYYFNGYDDPLAFLNHDTDVDNDYDDSVGLLVL
ncbi:MAG: hypothetical protein PUB03_00955 [bacterium]|nr:hypothetical protein [bacterium]